MDPKQQKNENQVLCPSDSSITEGQTEFLIKDQQKQHQNPSSNQHLPNTIKWLLIGCVVTIIVILIISLINVKFGLLIGYPILISTVASILACLSCMAIVEILNTPRKQKK